MIRDNDVEVDCRCDFLEEEEKMEMRGGEKGMVI